jgi:hypothetical protein
MVHPNMAERGQASGHAVGGDAAMSETPGRRDSRRAIVDAHVHLFDHAANRHEFLERRDETFEALCPRLFPGLRDEADRSAAVPAFEGAWHGRFAGWHERRSCFSPASRRRAGGVETIGRRPTRA